MKKKYQNGVGQSNMVACMINDLLVNKTEYITTGVPADVLVTKLSHEITITTGETEIDVVEEKAKAMIEKEITDEALVRFPTGNLFHGPKKREVAQTSKSGGDESESMGASEGEDELVEEVKRKKRGRKEEDDEDYRPVKHLRQVRPGEGRVSARKKKSRSLFGEYVFPSVLTKRSSSLKTSPGPTVAKKKPHPKSKKCSICQLVMNETSIVVCTKCSAKAHQTCKEEKAKGEPDGFWCCPEKLFVKWKCAICDSSAGKEKGVLVACDFCELKYHKSCHLPPIETKNTKTWRCTQCPQLSSPGRGNKRTPEKTDQSNDDDSESTSQPLELSDEANCSKCDLSFGNQVDKLSCISCRKDFHSGCCRVRDIANIARLGARKRKWRCDACKDPRGRVTVKDEPVDNSSDVIDLDTTEDEIKMEEGCEDPENSKDKEPASNNWWAARLRAIVVGKDQPPLGPIPDLQLPDVSEWSCAQTSRYFASHFEDSQIAEVFLDNEIDGKSLKLLTRSDVKRLCEPAALKLGTYLDILQHVKRLQLRVNDRRYIWADIM